MYFGLAGVVNTGVAAPSDLHLRLGGRIGLMPLLGDGHSAGEPASVLSLTVRAGPPLHKTARSLCRRQRNPVNEGRPSGHGQRYRLTATGAIDGQPDGTGLAGKAVHSRIGLIQSRRNVNRMARAHRPSAVVHARVIYCVGQSRQAEGSNSGATVLEPRPIPS